MQRLKQHCGKYAEMVQIIGPVYFNIYKNSFFEENEQGYLEEDASKECALLEKYLKGIELKSKRSSF